MPRFNRKQATAQRRREAAWSADAPPLSSPEPAPTGSSATTATVDESTPLSTAESAAVADWVGGDWTSTFLTCIMQGTSMRDACREAQVHFTAPYVRRKRDPEFRAAWVEAAEIGTEMLEQEAQRRAYHGVLEPVFYKGTECGQVRKYSDTLLIFLLKGRKPEVYREGVEDVGGARIGTLNINIVEREAVHPGLPQEGGGAATEPIRLTSVEVVDVAERREQGGGGVPQAAPVP